MKLRKVLILGASSDIGFKTVEKFLKQNHEVIAHYNKNIKKLKVLKKNYKKLKTFKLDLKDVFKVQKFLKKNIYLKILTYL